MERRQSEPNDLLVLLYRLAHRQQENFTTEAFAHVLRHLADTDRLVATRILDWLTDSTFFSTPLLEPLRIRTQLRTDGSGIPDINVEGDGTDVLIEVKLDGGLTCEQARPYFVELEKRARSRRALVALTGRKPADTGLTQYCKSIRLWGELGQQLVDASSEVSPISQYLVNQFVRLLNHLDLMPLKVRSRLSQALADHRAWAEADSSRPSILRDRIKSLRRLGDMEHVETLRNLLLQMESVLKQARVSYTFDSGAFMQPPWIGFNVNGMDYFFYLSLNQPERLTLQRWGKGSGVDPGSFDGSLGELQERDGKMRWCVHLDLLAPDRLFFEANQVQQVTILGDFFGRSFSYGETLRLLSRDRKEGVEEHNP